MLSDPIDGLRRSCRVSLCSFQRKKMVFLPVFSTGKMHVLTFFDCSGQFSFLFFVEVI